jgi:hypothetical protein
MNNVICNKREADVTLWHKKILTDFLGKIDVLT